MRTATVVMFEGELANRKLNACRDKLEKTQKVTHNACAITNQCDASVKT